MMCLECFGWILTWAEHAVLYAQWAVLGLAAAGVVWSPFSALLCGAVAYKRKLDVATHAGTSAALCLLFLLPGIYVLGRLLKMPIPRVVVFVAYLFFFTMWLLGPIATLMGFAHGQLTFSEGTLERVKSQGDWELRVFMAALPAVLNFVPWLLSIWIVVKARARNSKATVPSIESVMPAIPIKRVLDAVHFIVGIPRGFVYSLAIWVGFIRGWSLVLSYPMPRCKSSSGG